MTPGEIADLGYEYARLLPTGEWVALNRFLFTVGLLVGIDRVGYRTRFCYPSWRTAMDALMVWDGTGDPPGRWIKEKGRGVERDNPATFAGIPVTTEYLGGLK